MPWRFDSTAMDIMWVTPPDQILDEAVLDIGDVGSDVGFDSGNRENTTTIIDQGVRVTEGLAKPTSQGI